MGAGFTCTRHMSFSCTKQAQEFLESIERNRKVVLRVYSRSSGSQEPPHCGIQIYGWEWSYKDASPAGGESSYPHDITGVFFCRPGKCGHERLFKAVHLGVTGASEEKVLEHITSLEKKWLSVDFDRLTHGSPHFCAEFASLLGVQEFPAWVLARPQEAVDVAERDQFPVGAEPEPKSTGRGGRSADTAVDAETSPVMLHVYDVGDSGTFQVANRVLQPFGLGFFHCGMEVFGWEWSFAETRGRCAADTGVFSCRPRECAGHTYCTSLAMGSTEKSEMEVFRCIALLEKKWPGGRYNVLTRNCTHFCSEFCRILGVQPLPPWITRLAAAGHRCETKGCCCSPHVGAGERYHPEVVEVPTVRAQPWHAGAPCHVSATSD